MFDLLGGMPAQERGKLRIHAITQHILTLEAQVRQHRGEVFQCHGGGQREFGHPAIHAFERTVDQLILELDAAKALPLQNIAVHIMGMGVIAFL